MSITTALRAERVASFILAVVDYFCYCIIFGAIAVFWWIT